MNEPENYKRSDDSSPYYQLIYQMQNTNAAIRGFWHHQKKNLFDAVFVLDSELNALDILIETMKDKEFINDTANIISFSSEKQITRFNKNNSRKRILENYIKWYRAIIRLLSREGFWFELSGDETI